MLWMVSLAAAQQAEVDNVAWCFTSGLRVLFEEDHSRPEVSVRSLYEGGGSVGEPGVAHLVEHLWFQARPEGQGRVWDRLNGMGARFNAFTFHDQTVFETVVPRQKARTVMVLEAARLDQPLAGIDDAAFALERNVVKNEIGVDRGEEALYAAVFPDPHPYHHLLGGTEGQVQALTLPAAQAYAERWYRPDQMTLYVKGDLTTEQFEKVLITSFPKDALVREGTEEVVEACTPRAVTTDLPQVAPAGLLTYEGDVHARLGRIVWRYDPADEVMVDFDAVLMGWRLRAALDRSAACHTLPMRRAGMVVCDVELEEGEEAEKVLRKGIRVSRDLWQPNERNFLSRNYGLWRAGSIGRLYRDLEEDHDLAAMRFHLSGQQDWLEAELKRRSIEDFSEAARIGEKTFTVQGAQLAEVLPRARSGSEGAGFHQARRLEPPEQVDASVESLEALVAEPNWVGTEHRVLPNGLTVSVYPRGKTGLVRVAMIFPGGARAGGVLDAVAWNALPDNTTSEYEAALGLLGAWSVRRTANAWSYEVSGISVDKQLKLLADHLRRQEPSSQVVRSWRRVDDASVGVHWRVQVQRNKLLEPSGVHEPEALLEQARALDPKQVRAWVEGQLAPEGAHLIVVGDVDADQVLVQARNLFASMKTTVPPVRGAASSEPVLPAPTLVHHTDDTAVQSEVVLACRLDHATPAVTQVTRAVVDAAMFTTLREELGAVYTPSVALRRDGQGPRLTVYASVEKGRAGEALAAAQERIRALAGHVDPGALSLAKVQAAKGEAGGLDSGRGRMGAFVQRAFDGHPGTGGIASDLAAVTASQVQQTLGACAGHEVMSAVGPNGALDLVEGEQRPL